MRESERARAKGKKEMKRHLWNLWSLTDGEIGEEPPEKIMEEWK